jgi:hypothetical protein
MAIDENMTRHGIPRRQRWLNPRLQHNPVYNPGILFGAEPETCTCGVELDSTKTCLD